MSLHSDLMAAAAVPVLFTHLAESTSAKYVPAGTDPASVAAVDCIPGYERAIEVQEKNSRVKKRFRTLSFLPADVPSPSLKASVVIGSLTYTVESIDASGEGMVVLIVTRPEQMEKHRDEYRQRRTAGE